MTSRVRFLAALLLAGSALALPIAARGETAPRPTGRPLLHLVGDAVAGLAGSYDCYVYMGSQITYTYMGFTLDPDGGYEWGEYAKDGRYRGDGGSYAVQGDTIAFTGAMAEVAGTVKPKAQGRPSIELVPSGETWESMYCSPR